MYDQNQIGLIFKAIHVPRADGTMPVGIRLDGKRYDVEVTPRSQCRAIKIGDMKFLEQNPNSDTVLAEQARQGKRIVHAIPLNQRGPWGMIIDGEIVKPIPEL